MRQDNLTPSLGWHKDKKRVGRGDGSGRGTFSGKGCKGQKARAGCNMRPGFEGGQLPLIKKLPRKRGFTNAFRIEYEPVNLSRLSRFPAGSEVTPETLRSTGIVKDRHRPIKVLGAGNLGAALTVRVHKFSASARQKIEAAGGTAEEVAP